MKNIVTNISIECLEEGKEKAKEIDIIRENCEHIFIAFPRGDIAQGMFRS